MTAGAICIVDREKLEQARDSYEAARRIKPDFMPVSRFKLGAVNLLLDRDDEAVQIFRDLAAGTSDERAQGTRGLFELPLYRGRLQEALQILNSRIYEARSEGRFPREAFCEQLVSFVYLYQGKKDEAAAHMNRAVDIVRTNNLLLTMEWICEASVWVHGQTGHEDRVKKRFLRFWKRS